MLTLIDIVAFNVLPFICLLGGLAWVLSSSRIPEAPEDEIIAQHEEDLPAPQKEEPFIYDSYALLFDEMDATNTELSYITYHPETQEPLVVLDDECSEDGYEVVSTAFIAEQTAVLENREIATMIADTLYAESN